MHVPSDIVPRPGGIATTARRRGLRLLVSGLLAFSGLSLLPQAAQAQSAALRLQ